MARKSAKPKKPKDTLAAQHARFVETAKKLGASEDPKVFDKAFKKVTGRSGKTIS